MSFQVDIPSLKQLPATLDRLANDADKGRAYVEANTSLQYGEGLLNMVKGSHENAVYQVSSFLADIQKYTAAQTRNALQLAIRHYGSTDAEAAAQLDSTYRGGYIEPQAYAGSYRASGNPTEFADRAEPQDRYQPIRDYNTHPDFQFSPDWADYASPASTVRDTIWGATWLGAKLGIFDRAYDPYESWVKPIAGDWAGVRGCADVFDNVALALADMGANVQWASVGARTVWSGQAAAAFEVHLLRSAQKLADAAVPLQGLAQQYATASKEMFATGKAVALVISELLDAAVLFAVEASAAAATSETVVGGVVFGAAACYEGYKIWRLIGKCRILLARARSIANGLGDGAGKFGLIDGIDQLPVLAPPPILPS